MPETSFVAHLVNRWAQLYSDQRAVATTVTFLHFGGMLLGGGFALVADQMALRMSPDTRAEWTREITDFARVHVWVLWGLGIALASGVLMTVADLHTYLGSVPFWTKMGLVLVLMLNGYARVRAERVVQRGGPAGWVWLRRTSLASLVLWFAVVLVSTILNSSS